MFVSVNKSEKSTPFRLVAQLAVMRSYFLVPYNSKLTMWSLKELLTWHGLGLGLGSLKELLTWHSITLCTHWQLLCEEYLPSGKPYLDVTFILLKIIHIRMIIAYLSSKIRSSSKNPKMDASRHHFWMKLVYWMYHPKVTSCKPPITCQEPLVTQTNRTKITDNQLKTTNNLPRTTW